MIRSIKNGRLVLTYYRPTNDEVDIDEYELSNDMYPQRDDYHKLAKPIVEASGKNEKTPKVKI